MRSEWTARVIVTAVYALIVGIIAWGNRGALYYLDAWMKFTGISVVPLLCFFGYYLWHRSFPSASVGWKKGWAIGFGLVMSLAVIWLILAALLISMVAWMTPTRSVEKYSFLFRKTKWSFTEHFPRAIPADARRVRIFYNPGALQSPDIFQVGFTVAPEQIDALARDARRQATFAFNAGTENGVIEPLNYVAEDTQEIVEFTSDYILFYLDEKPPKGEEDWNHLNSHGTAISKQRCRVVYWAESG